MRDIVHTQTKKMFLDGHRRFPIGPFLAGVMSVPLVLFLVVSYVPKVSSETNITAGMAFTSHIEWTLAGSPYVVNGLLTIERTASLTIRQGVQVHSLFR